MHAFVVAVSAALAVAPRLATQGTVDAMIDKAVAAYAKVQTARGTFQQTITNPLTGTTVASRGEFHQASKPSRFAALFSDPKGDRIVADGKTVWVYTPSTTPGQVIRVTTPNASAGNFDLAGQFFTQPKTRYTITDAGTTAIAGRQTRALVLVPKTENASFARAKVWIDVEDGALRQFETVESSGLKRLVTVTQLSVNVPVDPKLFRFSPPKGVKIFDQGQGSMRASR